MASKAHERRLTRHGFLLETKNPPPRGLPDLRVSARPYYHGEAVTFDLVKEDWARAYEFLVDMMGDVSPDHVTIRLDERHGVLGFAEPAADDLAVEVEKHASG